MSDRCPFCPPAPEAVFHEGPLVLGVWDQYPVSEGHALLVTRRHVATWFDATDQERAELAAATLIARDAILRKCPADGFNIGINVGPAGGQTVPHLHVHVIPRRQGDVPNPRGGVRNVIPSKADYLADKLLSSGGDDPLLPHLRLDLSKAERIDIAVAFAKSSGVERLYADLDQALERGARLRLVTGDYLDITDPDALVRLLDLAALHPESPVALRAFRAADTSFHPKSYVFRMADGSGVAYVGSSNLSKSALEGGVEWNYRVITSRDQQGFAAVTRAFDTLFAHPSTVEIDYEWVDAYRKRRRPPTAHQAEDVDDIAERPEPPPPPNEVQEEALDALVQTRLEGNRAGLVVLATGLGKTWLSAFDSGRRDFKRVLFVAHREEILGQALATYRRIRPHSRLGQYNGEEKDAGAEVLFASIQTLGKRAHLDQFSPSAFDYIVVDEFHHAAAQTYRRLIQHFRPRFLLGLTATPERSDGGDLLQLCGENLVYRCDLVEGIGRRLLCPFHYFGVPDQVDYRNIPWRSTRFDEEELTKAVATVARAENALEQWRKRGGQRTLAFCVSTRHADFMRDFCRERGLRAAAVHSGAGSDLRAESIEKLKSGELQLVFAVDMFNEGVDVPEIDTVMMLRPTESPVLWLQQLGRGLRRSEGKTLKVIDYIGNHRTFLLKPKILLQLPDRVSDREMEAALKRIERGEHGLPPGCEVTYELEALDILRNLLRLPKSQDALKAYYEAFREQHGARPTASEAFHSGYNPGAARSVYGSWFGLVDAEGDLGPAQKRAFEAGRAFLEALETTQLTKSYKPLVLLAMLNRDRLPGEIPLDELRQEFRAIAERNGALRADVGAALSKDRELAKLLEQNPIDAWVGGRGTGGTPYFSYEGKTFRFLPSIPEDVRSEFQELVRELCDWRLAQYQLRAVEEQQRPGRFLAKVSHAERTPIVFLPDRAKVPDMPLGWVPMNVDGRPYEAKFAKIALNVVRRPDSDKNELPSILRGWFGHDAGLPGTSYMVACEPEGEGYRLEPVQRKQEQKLELWGVYPREQIPPLFGEQFSDAVWNSGFVVLPKDIILLVTLDKGGMLEGHKYADHFVSPTVFEWQSQNRTTRESKHGQLLRHHVERGIRVHLFVRGGKKTSTGAAPFTYCGPVTFQSWEREKPITIRWRMSEAISPRAEEGLHITGRT